MEFTQGCGELIEHIHYRDPDPFIGPRFPTGEILSSRYIAEDEYDDE